MTDIRNLKFSIRTRNLLINAGIDTVEKLLAADPEQLRRENMFGPVTMAEIDRKIREHTRQGRDEEENTRIVGKIYDALRGLPDHKVERFGFGVAIVTPSGRHLLVRIGS